MVRFQKLKEPGVGITFSLDEQAGLPWNPPPNGLVPIGDTGLYATPDEPADPRDCDRYPDSIYCGNPFTPSFAEFEPSFLLDECNVGVQFDGAFGFIRVPPIAIVWRKPECRNPPPPPPPELPAGDTSPVPFPFNNCDENSRSIIVVYPALQTGKDRGVDRDGNLVAINSYTKMQITSIEFPYTGEIGRYTDLNGVVQQTYSAKVNYKGSAGYIASEKYRDAYLGQDAPLSGYDESDYYFMIEDRINETIDDISTASIYQTSVVYAKQQLKGLKNYYYSLFTRDENGNINGIIEKSIRYEIAIKCGKISSNSGNYPPPPKDFNPPPKHCCMSCCPTNTQDDSLVRLLIEKVDKLSRIVGVDEYPASLPASLISKDEGFLGNLIPNQNKEIPNLTQFLAWYVERFDEVLGQWEIPIEIKDSDPSKPGDQPLGVKLPNMAEAIAEMFTLCFQTNLNSETLLNFAVRTAAETITDKQQNFITYKLLLSLTDWAGFKHKDVKMKMPSLFKLGEKRYDKILAESNIDVSCVEFDDKFGLEADLMRVREAIAILEANYKKKLNPNGDIKAQILKYLLDTYGAVKKVDDTDDDADFEKFITDIETEFAGTPGITSDGTPYGRPFNQRPKIRDLTDYQKPAEE